MKKQTSGGLRIRKKAQTQEYDPHHDHELKNLTSAHSHRHRKKNGSANSEKKSFTFHDILYKLGNNKVVSFFQSLDFLTGYKPINNIRSYYQPYTTGLSLSYLIVMIIFFVITAIYEFQKNQNKDVYYGTFNAPQDSANDYLPQLIGAGYVPSENYVGNVTWTVVFWNCIRSYGSEIYESACENVVATSCANVTGASLSDTQKAKMQELGLQCPSQAIKVDAEIKQSDTFNVLVANLLFYGSSDDVKAMLRMGGRYYTVVESVGGSDKPSSKIADDFPIVQSYHPSSNYSVMIENNYLYHKVIKYNRFAYDFKFRQDESYMTTDFGPGAAYTVNQGLPLITQDSSTVGLALTVQLGNLEYEITATNSVLIDPFLVLAGFLFFLAMVGYLFQLYNRWSFRNGRWATCGCCESERNQLLGPPGDMLTRVSYEKYLQYLFAGTSEHEPAGMDMCERIEEEYADYDTW
eukprot:CAMPEP_0197514870 /NCGR_PEP_ID=MMETSP1318-20131121/177_1 /TAXON_ID=552666 /ORGANISM="Partenskyella glossopodia, Strain RCC365" /LENGTH=463 /DNA_ID=CAMNT_0043063081 /DNA_START=164 /DNA_END=1552 /DNA_ORIENTATION=-